MQASQPLFYFVKLNIFEFLFLKQNETFGRSFSIIFQYFPLLIIDQMINQLELKQLAD